MAFNDPIIIPKTKDQAANTQKLIIRSFALNGVETLIYKAGIDSLGTPNSKPQQYEKKEMLLPVYAGRDDSLYNSVLGTPVFSNLVIPSFTYTDPTTKQLITTEGVTLDTVLMTVTQSKTIIKTPIQGRAGTVKEYVSDGDYQVNIKAILTGTNTAHPFDQVFNIKQILNAPSSIKFVSRWLQNLGVNLLVVENYTFPQIEGGMSYQAIDINCISDLPVELKIIV